MCSLETGTHGFDVQAADATAASVEALLGRPHPQRLWHVGAALRLGVAHERIHELTRIDPWFIDQIAGVIAVETRFAAARAVPESRPAPGLQAHRHLRRRVRRAHALPLLHLRGGGRVRHHRPRQDRHPRRRAQPHRPGHRVRLLLRHAAFALREARLRDHHGQLQPETVSTDYDTSDRLYFEPLTAEHVLEILDLEARSGRIVGVLVQFGGQTPLKLAHTIERAGYKLLGTTADAIDMAEDRGRFGALVDRLGIRCPRWGVARSPAEAADIAQGIGFPVLVRPSYVLGGRAMRVVYSQVELDEYMRTAVLASPDHPVLVDEFLHNATEFDVDAVADGTTW
jgi:carbamoyl-phosphate synthase large subunit